MVVAHILLGEMVPKNIAIAGPERTAILLVPPFLVFTTVMRPLIELFNLMANGVLRLLGVEPRDELEASFTSGELADLIAESGREGLLDDDESRRLARTLSSVEATVADVLVPPDRAGDAARPAHRRGRRRARSRETGFSRFPVLAARRPGSPGTCTSRTSSTSSTTRPPRCRPQRVRGLPEVPARRPARRGARRAAPGPGAPGPGGRTRRRAPSGLVTMEDLVEHYVGDVRDATHAGP